MNKRSHLHKKADSSASNPVLSQFQSRPNISQAKPQSEKPLTQTQTENQEFQQQKFDATKLELQAKYGTITPEGQERLTEVQEKMSGLLQRRLEQASSKGSNFAKIPISRPDAPSQLAVQTKLTIGEPGDKFEKDADQFAEELDQLIYAPVSVQAEQNLQPKEMSVAEKEIQTKPMLQLRAAVGGMTDTAGLETAINQARGGGQPLADNVRKPMEQFSGTDLSRVKVHTDQKADQLSRAIQARAFTTKQDIFFAKGEYKPSSREGKKLIFHEGRHVEQQNGAAVQRTPATNSQANKESTPPRPEKGKTGSLETVQRKLNTNSEEIFRKKMQELLPTVPETEVSRLVEVYKDKEHTQALIEAKKYAGQVEELAFYREDGSASISKASRSMVKELLQAYNPQTHHYILLGGSPAVLEKALHENEVSFSHLPLGGLTNAEEQTKELGKQYMGEELRKRMKEEIQTNPALNKYLRTYLDKIEKIEQANLVLVDYTKSGGSILVTADLLSLMSEKPVKLFTFSAKEPDEQSDLKTQEQYELKSWTPEGEDERTFVTLTDSKAYKQKIGLEAYQSLTLSILNTLTNQEYENVLQRIRNEEGQRKLKNI